jgi:dihydrofolate reductase
MKIHLIAAITAQGVIGNKQSLPWYIPEDLKHFKKITSGKTILMGRRTYEAIGRPLPNRENLVLDAEKKPIAGATVCGSLDEALTWAKKQGKELYVIGGANVYAQMLPMVDVMHLSQVKKYYPGDVYFPEYDKSEWQEIKRVEYDEFTAITYRRRSKLSSKDPLGTKRKNLKASLKSKIRKL